MPSLTPAEMLPWRPGIGAAALIAESAEKPERQPGGMGLPFWFSNNRQESGGARQPLRGSLAVL